jgi:hypothetical protein
MRRIFFTLLLVVLAWKIVTHQGSVQYGPGVMAGKDPIQSTPADTGSFELNDYKITPLADFKITAKVLAKRNYRIGREADLSPTDFALGWGQMSDEQVLDSIKISQSGRWYRWQLKELVIEPKEVQTHSANMHIVPNDSYVARKVKKVREGEVVTLIGHLIRADAEDGWRWVSSLTRDDVGAHACELFLVNEVQVLQQERS